MEDPDDVFYPMDSIGYSKYMISRNGKIKAIWNDNIFNGTMADGGRLQVALINDEKKSKTIKLQILLALIFIGPRPSPMHSVDHADRNPLNNAIWNLRWFDKSEQRYNSKIAEIKYGKTVVQMTLEGFEIMTWFKASSAGKAFGKNDGSQISKACKDNTPLCGYLWKYCTEFIEGEEWMMMENDIYETMFFSNKGRVLDKKQRFSFGSYNPENKYRSITMRLKGTTTDVSRLMQRMIMLAFYPDDPRNFDPKYEVNHKNEIRKDNRLENLEFLTHPENVKYSAPPPGTERNRGRPVKQYDLAGNYIQTFPKLSATGVHSGNIRKVCTGKAKTAGGFIWKYAKQ